MRLSFFLSAAQRCAATNGKQGDKMSNTFTMIGYAGNSKGEWIGIVETREWTATGSRHIGQVEGKVYGKGNAAKLAAQQASREHNGTLVRPFPMAS